MYGQCDTNDVIRLSERLAEVRFLFQPNSWISTQFPYPFRGILQKKALEGLLEDLIRDHSFSTYAKFSEKLTFLGVRMIPK